MSNVRRASLKAFLATLGADEIRGGFGGLFEAFIAGTPTEYWPRLIRYFVRVFFLAFVISLCLIVLFLTCFLFLFIHLFIAFFIGLFIN